MGNVPVVTEDVSPDFLTRALRSTGVIDAETVVAEVEHDRIGEGVGLMCNLARLTLRYGGAAHGAPSSVILKVPSNLPENRGVGDHFNFYEREGRFYAELGDSLPVRTPRCYYNHMDREANEFALLIEDFGGRTMVSQIAGIDAERAAEAVRGTGARPRRVLERSEARVAHLDAQVRRPDQPGCRAEYRRSWDHFVELFEGDLPEGSVAFGELLGPNYEAEPDPRRRVVAADHRPR